MKNSLLRNGFYNTLAGVIRIGLGVLTIPLLIRIIGIEEYGLWTLAYTVIGIVTLAEAGLSVATTVFVSQDLGKDDFEGLSQTLTVTFGGMFILSSIAFLTLFFAAQPIVNFFPQLEPQQQLIIRQAVQIGSIVVWSRLLQQVLVGVEQAYQRYDVMNVLNTIQSILLSLGMLVVVWLGGRTVDLMQWQAFVSILLLFSHVLVVRSLLRKVNLNIKWDKKKIIDIGSYSLISWLTSLGGMIFSRGDRLVIGSILGVNALGAYSAITDITILINQISALPAQPLLPIISNFKAQKDIDLSILHKQVKTAFQLNIFIALLIGGSLLTLRDTVLNIIFSNSYFQEYTISFFIITIIYSMYSINGVGYYVLLASKAANLCMFIQLISGISSIILIIWGASKFGLIGASFGNSGYLIVWLLTSSGMRQLSISFGTWLRWLKLPFLWFLGVILTSANFTISGSLYLRTIVLFIQSIALVGWLIIEQNIDIKSILRRILIKC
ncbi:oligosaccharide flippase family protein [Calothrix sp. NIES-3974]|uniref:oligosaccharide flippase family protein n=1 Tax=Calothrix sp. NIES-3974 TaxID=2005462 RepID=UPI000B62230E|nr:oligosaccharide flippase family protein [Calothrix sp. NIES-3974]BAZ05139.1 polysaccharide biosynthesis protein [Calothrix sp. NIES-3974]